MPPLLSMPEVELALGREAKATRPSPIRSYLMMSPCPVPPIHLALLILRATRWGGIDQCANHVSIRAPVKGRPDECKCL